MRNALEVVVAILLLPFRLIYYFLILPRPKPSPWSDHQELYGTSRYADKQNSKR